MSALLLLECSGWAQTGRLTEDGHWEECGLIDGGHWRVGRLTMGGHRQKGRLTEQTLGRMKAHRGWAPGRK